MKTNRFGSDWTVLARQEVDESAGSCLYDLLAVFKRDYGSSYMLNLFGFPTAKKCPSGENALQDWRSGRSLTEIIAIGARELTS